MKMIINIPGYRYLQCQNDITTLDLFEELVDAVKNGTLIPKGHGKIVDVKEVEEYLNNIQQELDGWGDTDSAIEIAKARMGLDVVSTIIEADKGE